MKKYYLASDYTTVAYQPIYAIWEVDMTWPYPEDQYTHKKARGVYKKQHLTNFFRFKVGTDTKPQRRWRFRDNLWECAALLIIMMFNDSFYPTDGLVKKWFRGL